MHYEIEIGGRIRHVTVTRAGAGFAVTVDGHTRQVNAARIDGQSLSLILDSAASRETVVVPNPTSGQLTVSVDGIPVPALVNGRRRIHGDDAKHAASGPQQMTAPMPGKIVKVLVGPGDPVAARQPLVVVEAMKMENELRAGRDGTVVELHAREGQSVEAGALLVVIS